MKTDIMMRPDTGLWAFLTRVHYWFACLFVIGWTGVLCGGFFYQFVKWEYPCPLCVIQRMCMMLALLGAAHIVRQGLTGTVTRRNMMMGWGLALVGCIAGSFAAWRQTMLHILPGDEGYGSTALGLHLYVWAWILFQASILVIGLVLMFAHTTAGRHIPTGGVPRVVGLVALGFAALVIAANAVAVFLEEGFHWFLPDDPTRYEFFYDVGILG